MKAANRIFFLALTCLFTSVCAGQSAKESGLALIEALFEKNYDEAIRYVDESMKSYFSPTDLAQLLEQGIAEHGNYVRNKEINETTVDGVKTIYYYTEFQKTMLDVKIEFSYSDKVTSMIFMIHKGFRKDNYFREEDLNIKSDTLIIPGSLLIPQSDNMKVLAILLHDAYGASDRNGTINKYQYLNDIGEGLYKKGIASFRYDKRGEITPELYDTDYTIYSDVVSDAINVVRHLKSMPKFKGYKIILVGHGLGGTLLPLLADTLKNDISGIVMMAANARPWEEVLFDQYKYFYSLNPSPEFKQQIERLEQKIAFLHSPGFNVNVSKDKLPFHIASFWNSLLKYNQIEQLNRIKIPVLILHAERDFRITEKDFTLWKEKSKNRTNISFRSYPLLNHYFMEWFDTRKSIPEEYYIETHVPDYVMKDIGKWVILSKIN